MVQEAKGMVVELGRNAVGAFGEVVELVFTTVAKSCSPEFRFKVACGVDRAEGCRGRAMLGHAVDCGDGWRIGWVGGEELMVGGHNCGGNFGVVQTVPFDKGKVENEAAAAREETEGPVGFVAEAFKLELIEAWI